ncbi:ribosomal protein L7/L12 [Sphingomicrobium clamense]|uniref:Ribosomal protein L7/L12 n=1 Tax=Sphingomicrobium clamense TaxID=2851013 RepID=A0ABS6V3V1_9SPHN|nr:ribosomal protein L7/L12 [Sphingomicrobium sp. B8]MBW0144228.1 ribosomal protein L7/L12 [Sphingomicrobium sp. B8]
MLSTLITLAIGFAAGYFYASARGNAASVEPLDEARVSADAMSRIDAAIERGEKIEAIKIARKDTGAGLAEAKKFVDARSAKLRPGDPIER